MLPELMFNPQKKFIPTGSITALLPLKIHKILLINFPYMQIIHEKASVLSYSLTATDLYIILLYAVSINLFRHSEALLSLNLMGNVFTSFHLKMIRITQHKWH